MRVCRNVRAIYVVIFDAIGVEKYILEFLNRLSREKYILHNKYGSWNLAFFAKVTLARRRKHSSLK